ncbi:GGGtGRT protein [uncultured Draconibacterium sp.]
MHFDAQFAGSSSVPAHVEMMELIAMGNNGLLPLGLELLLLLQ